MMMWWSCDDGPTFTADTVELTEFFPVNIEENAAFHKVVQPLYDGLSLQPSADMVFRRAFCVLI